MNDDRQEKDVARARNWLWCFSDAVLAAGFVLSYVGILAVSAVVAYILGLQQEPPFFLDLLCLLLLLLLILSASMIFVRTIRSKYITGQRGLKRLRLGMILGILICLVLPFTRFRPPIYRARAAGFRHYVKANVNVEAMQAWLKTLDPKICTGTYPYELHSGATIESWWPDAAVWAKGITPTNPHFATLSLDQAGQPVIRIMWLSWTLGFSHYGLVVGDDGLTLHSLNSKKGEYRLSVAPGAYVCYETE